MNKLFAYAHVLAVETLESLRKREEGQTMAEYAVVLAVITVAVVGVIAVLSGQISATLTSVTNVL